METNKVTLKQMMETKAAVTLLEDLLKSLKDGKVVVQQGEDYVDLQTPEMIDVKVEAKLKKDKAKFNLALSWRNLSEELNNETVIITSQPKTQPENKKVNTVGKTSEKKEDHTSAPSSDVDEKVYFGAGSGKKKSRATKNTLKASSDKEEKTDKKNVLSKDKTLKP